MIDLRERATEPELLDTGVDPDEARRSLADLRRVNRWLGGRRGVLRAAAPFLAQGPVRLLDVGCGSADLPAFLERRVARGRLLAVGLDLKHLHVSEAPASVCGVVGDVRRLPFREGSFDVVTASLFLHHFPTAALPGLLRSLLGLARRALIVNDLHRARVPYLFARAAFPWLLRSPVSVNDGLISIRSAFTPADLRDAFAAAGIAQVDVRRSFPYRLVAVAERVR